MKDVDRFGEAPLAQTLAVEIRAVHRTLKQRVREQGAGNDLTPSQLAVLIRLERDGAATVSGLARSEAMRPQSMSEIVKPLQKAGLVAGAPDPHDGRQMLMALTPKCREWIRQRRAASHDWLARAVETQLSPVEQRRLLAALTLLRRVVAA